MGVSLDKAGRHEAAAAAYAKAMTQQYRFPEAHLLMGIKSIRREEFQTSSRYFTQALEMQPDYPQAHLGLALSHMMLGQFDKAKQETLDLAKALNLDLEE